MGDFWDRTKEFFGMEDPAKYTDNYDLDRSERAASGEYARESRYESGSRESRYEGLSRDRAVGHAETPVSSSYLRHVAREPQYQRLTFANYQQASELAAVVLEGDVAVFTLSGMEKGEASQVLNYARGLSDGIRGSLKKLSGARNFAIIPEGIDLDQGQLDALAETL